MAANAITFTEKIVVDRPKEVVWDYTQNYDNITEWDLSVLEAIVIEQVPRTIKLKMRGDRNVTVVYKLENRPNKLALSYRKLDPNLMEHAGLTAKFEERNGTTLWSQTFTYVFKNGGFMGLKLLYYRWKLGLKARKAMLRAKDMIERIPYNEETEAASESWEEERLTTPQ